MTSGGGPVDFIFFLLSSFRPRVLPVPRLGCLCSWRAASGRRMLRTELLVLHAFLSLSYPCPA